MATILLIEDDPALVHIMTAILDSNGHTVHAAGTAAEGLAALECAPPELVLLDLTLPDTDGLVLLTKLSRHDGCARPAVIVVSGRNTQSDRVLGLRFGADDYIVKPFDVEELNARIEAVLRRARRPQPLAGLLQDVADICAGDLHLSMRRGTVTFAGETVQLTPTEFRLLVPLVSHPNEVLTRQALSHVVWGYDDPDAGHMIDVHVGRMRNKLRMIRGDVPLETVRGRGFTWRDAQPDEYASQEF